MSRKSTLATAAAGTVLALGLAACSGGSTPTPGGTGAAPAPGAAAADTFNASIDKVWNPSTKKGGVLKFANTGTWDSLDPGNTYYGYSFNFIRLYARALPTFN